MSWPKQRETWHLLSAEEIRSAIELARERGPGRYTLKELHADQWSFVRRPRRLGFLFKRAVLAGAIAGVRWVGRKSNKSQLYEVAA